MLFGVAKLWERDNLSTFVKLSLLFEKDLGSFDSISGGDDEELVERHGRSMARYAGEALKRHTI